MVKINLIVNNDYQQDSRVMSTIVPKKSCGQILKNLSTNLNFLKTLKLGFSYIEK